MRLEDDFNDEPIKTDGASSYLLRKSLMEPAPVSGWLAVAAPLEPAYNEIVTVAPAVATQDNTNKEEGLERTPTPPELVNYPISNASSEFEEEIVVVDPLIFGLDSLHKIDPASQPLHSPLQRRVSTISRDNSGPSFLATLNSRHSALLPPEPFEFDDTPPNSMSNSSLYFGLTPDEHEDDSIAWGGKNARRFRLDDGQENDLFAELRKQVGAMHEQSAEEAQEEMAQHDYHNDMLSRLNEGQWG